MAFYGKNGTGLNRTDESELFESDYDVVRAWGGLVSFMRSYCISLDPEGYAEAREFIDAFKQGHYEDWKADQNTENN